MTVARILSLPVFRRGSPRVISGHGHLTSQVRWVHTADVPDIAPLLNGGELILTTGMALRARPGAQRRYIGDLAEAGAAGLIVELGQRLTDFPASGQMAAQELGLPVVVLQRPISFVEAAEAIHSEIVDFRIGVLKWGEDIQREMIDLLLAGGGVPAVLDLVAQTLRTPLFLETYDHQLLYHAVGPTGAPDPLEVWEGLRSSLADAAGGDLVAAPVPMAGETPPGWLVAVRPERARPGVADVALERAANLIALTLLRARQTEELARRERGGFLSALAERRISTEDAERRAGSMGLEPGYRLLLPVAVEVRRRGRTRGWEWQQALEQIQSRVKDESIPITLGSDRPGVILAIAGLQHDADRSAIADAVASATHAAVKGALGEADVAIAIGQPSPWRDVGSQLRLAVDGVASTFALPDQPWYDAHALEAERLLWRWRDDEELKALVQRTLGPLLRHDEQSSHQLLPTLECLLSHGGRKSETARALHLNRQALYGRIRRIQELVDLDLDEPDTRLILNLAVRARRQMLATG